MDLVVDAGCPFELKTTVSLHDRHRAQLIQYLMLTGLQHGKLINFGGERIEHEFVNCHETVEHRRNFQVDASRWSSHADARRFHEIVIGLLRDWGTGLDRALYLEALVHFLGGEERVKQKIATYWEGAAVGRQTVHQVAPGTALEITSLRKELDAYESNLQQFLLNTSLENLFWVNVVSGEVRFVAMQRQGQKVDG